MALRPWSPVPIQDCGEPLLDLPAGLLRLEPHPYAALGAPYGAGASPFRLRAAVVDRLLQAQLALQAAAPGWRLAIFDAWRPLAVQRFMVEHTIGEECGRLGVDRHRPSAQLDAVVEQVGRFWAPPSEDPATPPPHSTGAAVDLTLADGSGTVVSMGSAIDAIGAVSEPDHYLEVAESALEISVKEPAREWHRRRCLLRQAMGAAGFAQHPNEWWHFSWGDQLWAWRQNQADARYGRWRES
jgi:D-alanyl-D-alanine dipeptidase